MNRIISISKVRARQSLSDDEGINDAITSARDAAHIQLSGLIGFVLEQSVISDTFFINPNRDVPIDGLYTLRLSSGFVSSVPPVEVRVAQSLADLSTASVVPLSTFMLLNEKGFLLVPEEYTRAYIRVTYTGGLDDGAEAPEWLVEAMIGTTIKVMSQQQIQDGKQEISKLIPALEKHLYSIIDPHLRFRTESIRPIG